MVCDLWIELTQTFNTRLIWLFVLLHASADLELELLDRLKFYKLVLELVDARDQLVLSFFVSLGNRLHLNRGLLVSQKLLLYITDVFIHSFLKFSKWMLLSFGRQDLIVSG